jgi:FAD/FMN-containing dehydrogenase
MPFDAAADLAALRRLGPQGLLLEDAADLEPFLVDHRRLYRGRALAVALPRGTGELAALLACCNERGIGVVPHGGNTSYCGGATPDESGRQLVIAPRRMNRVRDIDGANDSITVEAGCTLAAVQQAAASAGRYFPLELGSAGSCQIGGNLATNAGGLNVLRFGMARALVLGVEAVLADGSVLHSLRGLRKDNTGYDLTGLLVGSEGTLGVITAATLKLWPAMRHSATAMCQLADPAAALEWLALLRAAAGEELSSFELIPASALELLRRHLPELRLPFGPGNGWYVLCELATSGEHSPAPVLEHAVAQAAASGLLRDAVFAASAQQRDALWQLRESIPEAQRRAGPSFKHDVSVPLSALPSFVEEASRWVHEALPEALLVAYGHAGDGNLHYNLTLPVERSADWLGEQQARERRAIHDLVAAHGGSFSAEHGIGRLKVEELERYGDPGRLAAMRQVKRALDPRGIMNPGKVLRAG